MTLLDVSGRVVLFRDVLLLVVTCYDVLRRDVAFHDVSCLSVKEYPRRHTLSGVIWLGRRPFQGDSRYHVFQKSPETNKKLVKRLKCEVVKETFTTSE